MYHHHQAHQHKYTVYIIIWPAYTLSYICVWDAVLCYDVLSWVVAVVGTLFMLYQANVTYSKGGMKRDNMYFTCVYYVIIFPFWNCHKDRLKRYMLAYWYTYDVSCVRPWAFAWQLGRTGCVIWVLKMLKYQTELIREPDEEIGEKKLQTKRENFVGLTLHIAGGIVTLIFIQICRLQVRFMSETWSEFISFRFIIIIFFS